MSRLQVRSDPSDYVPFTEGKHAYAFNGELYRSEGHVPSGGLGEAVAAATVSAHRLDGMYAIAHREPTGDITVRRDPLGIKPLFLLEQRGIAAVASEITALLPLVRPASVRPEAIAQFLVCGRVVDGGSFLAGIRPMRRGETVRLHAGESVTEHIEAPAVAAGRGNAAGLHAAFQHSMNQMLLTRRPLGVAVSGGLDSTMIADELARRGHTDVRTVSICPKPATGPRDGVTELAELGLHGDSWQSWQHHTTTFGPHDLLDGIPGVVAALQEPTALTSAPMYARLARLAQEAGIVVLVVGEGADELFGGYSSYLSVDCEQTTVEDFLTKPQRVGLAQHLVGHDAVKAAFHALRASLPTGQDTSAVIRAAELDHSLEPLLRRTDHLLMACGIEGRTPFLHGGVPAEAQALSWHELVGRGRTKQALRVAWSDRLPRAAEPKRPFRAPITDWFTGEIAGRVTDEVERHRDRLAALGIRTAGVDEVLRRLQAGEDAGAELAFSLLSLGSWAEWLDRNTTG